MDVSQVLGPFDVVKESFSSRWKLESSRSMTHTMVSVRITGKEKELRIEPKESSMKEVYLMADASCDDFEEGKFIFSVVLPVYKIRLSFTSPCNSEIPKLYEKLFVETLVATNRSKVVIPKPNMFRSCPIRSDVLMSCSDELMSPQQLGRRCFSSKLTSSTSFGIIGARAKENLSLFPQYIKNVRSFRSGLTPPEKKPNHSRSPQSQQHPAMKNNSLNLFIEDKENSSTLHHNKEFNKNSLNVENNEIVVDPTKNLSSLLDEQVSGNKSSADQNGRESLRFGDILLTTEQSAIISSVQSGKNVFFTGGAGTGKSTLLKHILQCVRQTHDATQVFVTATTGLAACAIQGSTLHQLFGIPAVSEDSDPSVWDGILQKTLDKRSVTQRLRGAKVIIIDEISMLGPRLFEVLQRHIL